MSIDIMTCITDYAWNDDTRPELRLSDSEGTHYATLGVGGDQKLPVLELRGESA